MGSQYGLNSIIPNLGLACSGDYNKGPLHIGMENAMQARFILEASRSDGSLYRVEISISSFLLYWFFRVY